MAHRTVGVGQTIRLSGTATTSTAFKVQSNVLRIVASGADAYVAIGTDPVATTTDFLVSSGEPESLAMLKMSQRVVGITTIDGGKTVLSAPEGTGASAFPQAPSRQHSIVERKRRKPRQPRV